jgi:hypothetical protein
MQFEQERVGTPVDLAHECRRLLVEERRGPSVTLESAAAVLIRRANPCITPSTETNVVVVSFIPLPEFES